MLRVALASDLHLEFNVGLIIKNTQNADVLILSGDIMIAQDMHDHPEVHPNDPTSIENLGHSQQRAKDFRDFLKRCSFQFPHVIYVAGNHEFYHGKFHAGIDYLREECNRFPNIHFLEDTSVTIDDVVFVGGTLWTDMNKMDPLTMQAIPSMMNDFRIIKNDKRNYARLSSQDVVTRHIGTLRVFDKILTENKDKVCVVVGHHAPTYQSIHEKYLHDRIMNGGYASDLSEFILDHPQIVLWTHGHMHDSSDYMIGTTQVICNPLGYPGERSSDDPFNLVFLDI